MSQVDIPNLTIAEITDAYVRKNFEALNKYFREQNQLLDFKFFEREFTEAETGVLIAHGLKITPLDILVTHLSGAGDVTFQYGQFDSDNLVIDVSGPCRIRFFVGTYAKFQSSVETGATDAQKFTSGI